MSNLFECGWVVSNAGYRIDVLPAVESTTVLGSSLERRVIRPISLPENHRHYDPMLPSPEGEPLLFRTFADLDETEEAIISFANRYGLLTIPWNGDHINEDIYVWFNWINAMREHIQMFEAGGYRSEYWQMASANFEDNVGTSVKLALRKDGKNGGMALKAGLPSLRVALWAQLGLWISTPALQMNQKKCIICRRWITYGTGTGHRRRGKTCGETSCKNAADHKLNHAKRKEAKK